MKRGRLGESESPVADDRAVALPPPDEGGRTGRAIKPCCQFLTLLVFCLTPSGCFRSGSWSQPAGQIFCFWQTGTPLPILSVEATRGLHRLPSARGGEQDTMGREQ